MYPKQRIMRLLSSRGTKRAAVFAIIALTLSGCSLLPREEAVLQPPLIQPVQEKLDLVEATRGSIQTSLKGTATFVSSNVKTLSFTESGGQLKSVNVKLGQEVKAGDLLAELETEDLALQVRLQKLSVERVQLLYSEAVRDGASGTDKRLKEIDLEREQISLQAMQSRLNKSQLYSPISGTVIYVDSIKTGDRVNAYQTIVTVADPSSMQLTYVASDAKDVLGVEAGMPVSLKYKGKDYTGKVLQSPSSAPVSTDQAKPNGNAVTIVMGIDHAPEGIQIGHSADMTIELQKRENAIVLPRKAIRSYMGRSYVQVADGERKKEVDVEVGLTTPTEVEIVKGLEEGQQVILNN
ncbi:efflux RND transporter periplasmic adaptor subunit [Paenibacillus sp. ATY16]|uniref:efflux RND transporter periplasmic adaptor subunit n=1 Tax=Paenibacillus sp. ATY16 TaxID=1759312 RepID=UPI00200DD157|nr:efflux RND transporter periplasmic adaptor subunit [Paenibacillus sp. ATY16]